MAAETTQEPTMEEILASIRRIISEEDGGPAAAAPPPPVVDDVLELSAPEPMPAPIPEPVAAAPVPMPAPKVTDIEDLDVIDVVESFQDADAEAPPVRDIPDLEEGLVGQPALESAIGSFGRLAAHLPISDNPNQTLEGVVQDMLRPMLKQWLDANLPRIVEEKVEAEITRLARVVRRAK